MLKLQAIRHRYGERSVLDLASLELEAGGQALLLGPSGSGKTTLLHIAAGLLRPTQGSVELAGQRLDALAGRLLDRFRGRQVGIVFQKLHLIGSLTALQNLLVAQYSAGLKPDAARAQAALEALGIGALARALPAQLSQGQAQRLAVARAVINEPALIVADEPTASLDDANAEAVLALLQDHARACGAALLVATHDARARGRIARSVNLAVPA
ncbi:MAG: ABC transporter ATP-binding protein [Solimonas sp.]